VPHNLAFGQFAPVCLWRRGDVGRIEPLVLWSFSCFKPVVLRVPELSPFAGFFELALIA